MDLIESIKIFRRVAQKESFSQVAAEFRVTQPTISKSVAQLEESLGVSLFRRSTRGLSLTGEGQKLFHASGAVINQLDALISLVKNEKLLLQGQLRITASLAFARLILAPLFNEFSDLHPALKFHFHLSDGYVDLVENNIDLAIRIGDLPDSSLKAHKVGLSRRSFYASKKYLAKFGMPKDISSLRKHRLLFYTRLGDRPVWPVVDADGRNTQFKFEPHLQSDGSDLIRESVLNDVGIAFMPSWMMIGNNEFKVKTLERFVGPPSPIYVLSSSSQDLNVKQKTFTDYIRIQFEKINALSLRS